MKDVIAVKSEYRLSEWTEIFKNQKESGLSVREFCRQNQIKEPSYYYFLKKIRKTVCNQSNIVEFFPNEFNTDYQGLKILYHGAEIQVDNEEKLLKLLRIVKQNYVT